MIRHDRVRYSVVKKRAIELSICFLLTGFFSIMGCSAGVKKSSLDEMTGEEIRKHSLQELSAIQSKAPHEHAWEEQRLREILSFNDIKKEDILLLKNIEITSETTIDKLPQAPFLIVDVSNIEMRFWPKLLEREEVYLLGIKKVNQEQLRVLGNVSTKRLSLVEVREIEGELAGNIDFKAETLSLPSIKQRSFRHIPRLHARILSLNYDKDLKARSAQYLSEFTGSWIEFYNLKTIDENSFRYLLELDPMRIALKDLEYLDAQSAQYLSQLKIVRLHLNTAELDEETARYLAEFKGWSLYLDEIEYLEPQCAKYLSQYSEDDLHLSGLKTLDILSAEYLSQYRGRALYLNGIETLEADAAQHLSQFTGATLELKGLQQLDVQAAQYFSEFTGLLLYLSGLRTLDTEAAVYFARYRGNLLDLSGVRSLSPQAAESLSGAKVSALNLSGLETISPEAAQSLSRYKGGTLALKGLKKLSMDAVTPLTQYSGRLYVSEDVQSRFPRREYKGMVPKRLRSR